MALVLVVGTALPAAAAAASTGQPHGNVGVRLLGSAGSANPLARSYIVARLAPGATIRRRIVVLNSTASTALIHVYAAGASQAPTGFSFAPGRHQNQLSRWTSVSDGFVKVPAGQAVTERVVLHVPAKASGGARYAVVWAAVSSTTPGSGVRLVNRVGVRMYVVVSGVAAPSVRYTIRDLHGGLTETGTPMVTATVHNTGQGALVLSGTLNLTKGRGSLRAGPFGVAFAGESLAPGATERATALLPATLPRGSWLAHLRLSTAAGGSTKTGRIFIPATATAAGSASAPERGSRSEALCSCSHWSC